MVFFSCSKCGETMRKKGVEAHYYRCKPEGFSCLDCHKDFWGDSYAKHTECITEDERYGSADYVPKVMTGKIKQQQWVQRVRDAVQNTNFQNPALRNILEKIIVYESVPKKEVKFINFLKSSYRTPAHLGKEAWKFLEQLKAQELKEKEQNLAKNNTLSNGSNTNNGTLKESSKHEESPQNGKSNDIEISKPPKKKQKMHEETSKCDQINQPFKWKSTIKCFLKEAPEEGIKLKKLEKKVIAAYKASCETEYDDVEIRKRLKAKLFNNKFIIDGKFVKLKELQ